ncbi:hemolysin III family protein [Halomonas beimenensis]|uniref:Putative membrane channel-forming protein YqfA, hemolysin III family n=1 Tax=Halomonas beimenensis TaxID=475662 RepID=A0A291P2E1_9GAMM|nr:hemolysin III family protein [Halomonas beimenensis]ATJ81044.1 putative membrane channel-forming protein YqfA, hemolysin III family [Halomonas beimenensis]
MQRRPSAPDEPAYSVLEEILHSASHGLGAVLSLAGTVVLVILTTRAAEVSVSKTAAVGLYGSTLVLLYTASTLYHGTRHPRLKRTFQVLDHCAIYALIAGTYTPFLMVNLQGSLGEPLLAVIWSLAVIGVVLKVWRPRGFDRLHLTGYFTLGWLILVAAGEIPTAFSPTGLGLLIAGGLTYSIGVVFFLIRAIPFNHAVWHLCVMGGSACHYFAVYTEVLPFRG